MLAERFLACRVIVVEQGRRRGVEERKQNTPKAGKFTQGDLDRKEKRNRQKGSNWLVEGPGAELDKKNKQLGPFEYTFRMTSLSSALCLQALGRIQMCRIYL